MAEYTVTEVDNQDHGIHIVFYQLGKGIMERYGIEGEAALRRGIHNYAYVRGDHVRRLHKALGMKINLKNFYYCGTNPYHDSSVNEDIGRVTEEEDCRTVDVCPFAQFFKDRGDLKLGEIYCEEAHPPLWQGYNPAIMVNLGRILTREGDDYCDFRVFLRPARMNAEQRKESFEKYDPDFKGDRREEYVYMTTKQGVTSKVSIMVNEFYKEFCNSFGEAVKPEFERMLELTAEDVIETVKKAAKKQNVPFDKVFWDRNCSFGSSPEEDGYWDEFSTPEVTEMARDHFYAKLNQVKFD